MSFNMTNKRAGELAIGVGSEGKFIPAGTDVVVEVVVNEVKDIYVLVTSMKTSVRLNYFDTDLDRLIKE